MKQGDLVVYRNTPRIPTPLIGIILSEQINIAKDTKFFNVLLPDGVVKLIPDLYLRVI
jgi:hypothetical protein